MFVMAYIDANNNNIPSWFNSEQKLKYILDSIYARGMAVGTPGGSYKTVWNIYIHPPCTSITTHYTWRRKLAETTYLTTFYGAGKAIIPAFSCTKCKSIDHPTGLCPFPLLPDWINDNSDEDGLDNNSAPDNNRPYGMRHQIFENFISIFLLIYRYL